MTIDYITIENVGPVAKHIVPVAPGITIVTGENEAGKSTCIAAVAALAGRDVDLAIRDGSKSGMIEGCGMTLVLTTKKTHRSGSLEADSMETKLDISKLVDPNLKQAAAATKTRIKTLLSISGQKMDVADFASVLPVAMQNEITIADADEDPVEMAGKIKRRMERRARDLETEASVFEGKVQAAAERLRDQDLTGDYDEAAMQKRMTEAAKALAVLESKQEVHDTQKQAAWEAAQKVAAAESAAGESLEDAERVLSTYVTDQADAERDLANMREEVTKVKATLARAEQFERDAVARLTSAVNLVKAEQKTVEQVKTRLADLDHLREVARTLAPKAPSPEELQAAKDEMAAAQKTAERGGVLRELLKVEANRKELHKQWQDATQKAVIFRDAASATDRVLSEALDCDTLKMIEGDLCYVEGDRSEPYARLSDGKRWQVAIRELASAHRKAHGDRLCILPIPQPAWEGLTEINRATVYEAATAAGVAIVTGKAVTGQKELASIRWVPGSEKDTHNISGTHLVPQTAE